MIFKRIKKEKKNDKSKIFIFLDRKFRYALLLNGSRITSHGLEFYRMLSWCLLIDKIHAIKKIIKGTKQKLNPVSFIQNRWVRGSVFYSIFFFYFLFIYFSGKSLKNITKSNTRKQLRKNKKLYLKIMQGKSHIKIMIVGN